jgi:hypothetical protein
MRSPPGPAPPASYISLQLPEVSKRRCGIEFISALTTKVANQIARMNCYCGHLKRLLNEGGIEETEKLYAKDSEGNQDPGSAEIPVKIGYSHFSALYPIRRVGRDSNKIPQIPV